jgi:hypothetical protein
MTPIMSVIYIAAALLVPIVTAEAHNLKQSESTVTLSGDHLQWTLVAHDTDLVTFFKANPPPLGAIRLYLERRVGAMVDGKACHLDDAFFPPAPEPGHLQVDMHYTCPTPTQGITLFFNAFFGDDAHVNDIHFRGWGTQQQFRFTPFHSSWDIPSGKPTGSTFYDLPWGVIVAGGVAIVVVIGWGLRRLRHR